MSRSWIKGFSVALAAAFLWTFLLFPPVAMAQEAQTAPDAESVCKTAEMDAKATHQSMGYLLGGFFCGIIGWVIAAVSNPTVPADKLAAQPPEFVDTYTRCYTAKAKKMNQTAACSGWLVGASLALLIVTIQEAGSVD